MNYSVTLLIWGKSGHEPGLPTPNLEIILSIPQKSVIKLTFARVRSSSRATFILIIANYCEGISYYMPNTGLQTFHSLTHLILIKPDEVDVDIMPILHRGKLKNGEVNDVLPRNSSVLSK